MSLYLAALVTIANSVIAQVQPSEADKAVAQKIIADGQKQVCERLADCKSAQFRYGKIVQYQGRYLACGEVISTDGKGSNDYQIWMLLVGNSEPPMLEETLPALTRQRVHVGPCATPTGAEGVPATDNATQSAAPDITTGATTKFRPYDTATVSKSTNATVTVSMLEVAARRVQTFKPKDQFDVGPRFPELVGKTFTIDILPRNGVGIHRGCMGYPEYFFDTDKSQLNLTYGDSTKIDDYDFSYRVPHPIGDRVAEYTFECSSRDNKPYYGSNAFGATVAVDAFTQTFVAIAVPLQRFKPMHFDWHKQMAPQKARAVAGSIRLRIHGTIGEWLPGQPILCGEHIDRPTIDFPTEARLKGCLVNADVDHVDVFDKNTGQSVMSDNP